MTANKVRYNLPFLQPRFHVRQIRIPPSLPHSDRIDVYHRPSLLIYRRILSVFVFACPIFNSHVFAAAESFASVETRGASITGNECAEQWVGYMPVDGIFVSVDMDLTMAIINEGSSILTKVMGRTLDRKAIEMALRMSS